ncbi:MAG: ATP-binding protein [Planctomycetota bacterium]
MSVADRHLPDSPPVGKANPSETHLRSERDAFVRSLAEGLAHQLKNPLSILRMNIQLLREDIGSDDSVAGRQVSRRAEILEMQARRLQETLDEFLRFARSDAPERRPTSVNEVLQELLDFLAAEFPRTRIRLLTSFREDVPMVLADRNLLKQALLNVLVNAQQAMPSGGELIVSTADDAGAALIRITDTGVGIPPENLRKLFQVYFSTKEGGTGLGLATARRIIEQHEGSVTVDSAVGKGTSFAIRLPAAPPSSGSMQGDRNHDQ